MAHLHGSESSGQSEQNGVRLTPEGLEQGLRYSQLHSKQSGSAQMECYSRVTAGEAAGKGEHE